MTFIEVDGDKYSIRYDWSRSDGLRGEHRQSYERSGHFDVRHGEDFPVDLIRVQTPSRSCEAFVRLGFEHAGAEDLAHHAVRNDVWLMHTDPQGVETSTKLSLAGDQGEGLRFLFDPFKLAIPSQGSGLEDFLTLGVRVSGTVRSWLESDGEFLVVVDAKTVVRSFNDDGFMSSGRSGEGAKTFQLMAGESVKLVLPSTWKQYKVADPDPDALLPVGFQRKDGFVQFDAAEVLKGHEMALVIQASVVD